jgi:hypothetical protein
MLYDSVIKAVIYAVIGHDGTIKVPVKSKPYSYFFPIGTLT